MASLYSQMGINPKTVAERLRHSSVVIVLDTYSSHLLAGMQEAAAVQFDAVIGVAESNLAREVITCSAVSRMDSLRGESV